MKGINIVILVCVGLTMLSHQSEQKKKHSEKVEAVAVAGAQSETTNIKDDTNANDSTSVDNKDKESHSTTSEAEANVNDTTETPNGDATSETDQEEDSTQIETIYAQIKQILDIGHEDGLRMSPIMEKYQESFKTVIDALKNNKYDFLGISSSKNNNEKTT